MIIEQIKQYIQGSKWVSIATELRPTKDRTGTASIQHFYLSRSIQYLPNDKFESTIINSADAEGKIPLIKIVIKGQIKWLGNHPIAKGAQNVCYISEVFEITPLHQSFVNAVNQSVSSSLNKWEVNVMQDIHRKAFPAFDFTEGQVYVDYDLIYIFNDMLFMGSKHVDGRPTDSPENRPTNLQVPLIRLK